MPLLPLKRSKYQLFQKDCLNLTSWFPLQAKILKFRACNCLSVLNFEHMLIYRIQICLSNYFIAWVKPDCPTLRPICWEGEGGTWLCLFQKAVSAVVTRWNLFQIQSWWYSGIHGRYFCHNILSSEWLWFIGAGPQGYLIDCFILSACKFSGATYRNNLLTCFIYDTEIVRGCCPKAVAF